MSGRIDHTGNIFLYLNPDQIKNLETEIIGGTIVETPKIKRQGTYEISMIEKRVLSGIQTNEDNYWGKRLSDFSIKIYLGEESYENLKENGTAYSRKATDGSEIFIYDSSKLDFTQEINLEDILFYIENKDKLSENYR
jgi:hypothetical protein